MPSTSTTTCPMEHKNLSTKFFWGEYKVPRRCRAPSSSSTTATSKPHDDDDEKEEGEDDQETFLIRHLKQGRTGAVKTWPAAELLLDYLALKGGLGSSTTTSRTGSPCCSSRHDNNNCNENTSTWNASDTNTSTTSSSVLDLTRDDDAAPELFFHDDDTKPLNIVELGGGTGYLSVGLALSLNHHHHQKSAAAESSRSHHHQGNNNGSNGRVFQPRVRLLCTDMDKGTIKNMRYNVTQQARDRHVTKAVRVETLDWSDDDLGGEKFSKALQEHFGGGGGGITCSRRTCRRGPTPSQQQQQSTTSTVPLSSSDSPDYYDHDVDDSKNNDNNDHGKEEDPIRLVTHVIGSDVHYGETTLEPLSTVISAFKLRNPKIAVILAIKERSPNAMEDLKGKIEQKVQCAVASASDADAASDGSSSSSRVVDLEGFSVSVRNVIHNYGDNLSNLKMIEC